MTIIGQQLAFPDYFVSVFNAGTPDRPHPKYAVQLFWPNNTPDGTAEIITICFSTN